MTSPDCLENFHSFFSASFLLAKECETFSSQLLQSFSLAIFLIFNSELVGCFVKIIRNDQRRSFVWTPSMYKTPLEEKGTRNFWPVINYKQWLILYLYRNGDVLDEWQLLR